MKVRILALMAALSLLLTGCGFLDGSYVSVTPHREQRPTGQLDVSTAGNYQELLEVLSQLVASGQETATIQVAEYPQQRLESGVSAALMYIRNSDPVGAYAVEEIQCDIGTSGNLPAVAVTVTYRQSITQLRRIQRLASMEAAEALVGEALEDCDAGIVLLVEHYEDRDMTQFVEDYAAAYPQYVMEVPQVTENVYGQGRTRLVELMFTYQNSREDLRKMQNQVEPVFNAALLYVSGDGAERQKLSQLYAFLMERFDYKVETSLTPAYSLLRHGVGDSRAFATVYAAMCRGAGLECLTVTGTRSGEPRTWNIVKEGGNAYHVDLLRCNELGRFQTFTDAEMTAYVWDYSAYPACSGAPVQETIPAETISE